MTEGLAKVHFREFWGEAKRQELAASLDTSEHPYNTLSPVEANRFSLRVAVEASAYANWPTVTQVAALAPFNGPVERRGMALISMDKVPLAKRIEAYFDESVSNVAVAALHPSLMMTGNRIEGPEARRKVLSEHKFDPNRIVRFPWKPFDERWCYLANIRPLFSEPSPDLIRLSRVVGNAFFVARDDADTPDEGPPTFFSSKVGDYDLIRGHARYIPVIKARLEARRGRGKERQHDLFGEPVPDEEGPNLSPAALAYTASLNLPATADTSRLVWHHALATTHAPAYLADNAAALRAGWPRIPTPADRGALEASAALGARLAQLLDPDTPVPGVTTGNIRPELAAIAVPTTKPGAAKDWHLRAWGSRSDKGVTMPGRGSTTPRPHAPEAAPHAALFGAASLDVNMNPVSCWANVPEAVWEIRIGGYQVIKKWLSYRDASILDRPLTPEEVAHVRDTARRLAAILLMGPDLDAAHAACAAAHAPLPA